MNNFKEWAVSFSGCDGGDIGSESAPSIWVCGIEPGAKKGEYESDKEYIETLKKDMAHTFSDVNFGYDKEWAATQDKYPFNRNICKILSVIDGGSASDYKKFIESKLPFSDSSKGYFKMNLYPLPFSNQDSKNASNAVIKELTGFNNVKEYEDFIRTNRFPFFNDLVKKYAPKLIICVGLGFKDDFIKAFGVDSKVSEEKINDKRLLHFKGGKSLVVILPFVSGTPSGLNSDDDFSKFGARIRELLAS
ncbi:hypothetical protein DCO58_12110 [Helicobacter saguini]|uniref:Uracil-DNA glycosylase-like domain-containing protein n=1 Tax=Helicobacter saguini TaxID=1548018 RepID=A0A099B8R0_9HELI|nr:hypothetical protein [Helicobacter saguini]MWV60967.1 hypothetical protein [Helicobacter saguini]MWV68365.1 hypothetical protein [Helicobacter saguini]MWV70171.1 hypothetical protein [Helicobacter saguini]MWV72074.1 hypothetical protein [Helicobacter saguini]TLD93706.1 hypothetical protein LS64_007890 [Helicobacter saguini]